ncbi:hypothetical protein SSX86_019839 [Deinandra increscens subsp. villosa]|uniref:Protein kinase domain-containing protein n=1 Tax=Deinandra increscens subsp. villosa TaxID=3103831 RepID=A0AAP0CTD6_9ASTR
MEKAEHLKIPLEEIKLATNFFSDENFIARGGFGKVYIGKLTNSGQQNTVAVKRLDRTMGQGDREFLMEIQMLSCYKHTNLVSLLGYCEESGENILVYEHAKHGSLDKYLTDDKLSWLQRLKISLGAACGFNYLHNDVGPQHRVLHRDIKSSNILLNENWEAKISDFGLSKIGPSNVEFTFLVTNACGTYGYIDPVYRKTGILTKESDVYSFGVVLFEILCGRLALINAYQDERRFLDSLAKQSYEQNRLHEIILPSIKNEINGDSCVVFSMVAYQCLNENRTKRPTMAWIVEKLGEALDHQENVEALIECVTKDVGFSEGKPIAAFTIYKCLINWRSLEAERTSIFDRLIKMISLAIEGHDDNNEHLAYWLSNASTLLFLVQRSIKSYGANSAREYPPTTSLFGRVGRVTRTVLHPSNARHECCGDIVFGQFMESDGGWSWGGFQIRVMFWGLFSYCEVGLDGGSRSVGLRLGVGVGGDHSWLGDGSGDEGSGVSGGRVASGGGGGRPR